MGTVVLDGLTVAVEEALSAAAAFIDLLPDNGARGRGTPEGDRLWAAYRALLEVRDGLCSSR
ncbi:hypothetical protein GCM10011594_42400 [Nakamurella endophytica]|uniref:Uncharacterized protein n=1 Tax=Nakamurella endophytica TaxID=1748367 RepID=A0A917TCZ6_9ACTN|nr:hypothetical protein GCM10011594_42400 [Nakamurella endophytica]